MWGALSSSPLLQILSHFYLNSDRYKDGRPLYPGDPTKGSTRLDVYDPSTKTVYDYKFVKDSGNGLKAPQIEKIKIHGPDAQQIIEVNPTVRYNNG